MDLCTKIYITKITTEIPLKYLIVLNFWSQMPHEYPPGNPDIYLQKLTNAKNQLSKKNFRITSTFSQKCDFFPKYLTE